MSAEAPPGEGGTLDPADWPDFRQQAHRMLDDILDYLENIRRRPVWQPIPDEARQRFRAGLPVGPTDLAAVHREFMRYILPFGAGNVHPGFMGWVHGGGTPVGMLAEMLAAGLNANLGGRDHIPIEVERQIVEWMRGIFGFPESSSGLFVTGTSMANLIGVLIARDAALGFEARCVGVTGSPKRLAAYASVAAHSCIGKALDMAGIGSDALRPIAVDAHQRMDLNALEVAIEADRRAGFTPFLVVGTAGTVDTGAIDDLDALAGICRRERLWFHVDGAFGALAMLAPDLAPRLKGIECADSLAFDFHKWGQTPYDAGFVLVRDGVLHRNSVCRFASLFEKGTARSGRRLVLAVRLRAGPLARLSRAEDLVHAQGVRHRGAGSGDFAHLRAGPLPGKPDLGNSRVGAAGAGGTQRGVLRVSLGGRAAHKSQDRHRAAGVRGGGAVEHVVGGRVAIRAAIVNHRTGSNEIDALVAKTVELGRAIQAGAAPSRAPSGEAGADWPPQRAREAALRDLRERMAADPGQEGLQFELACLLTESGRTLEARNAYLELLAREPAHRLALNNLGTLLYATGYRTAARTAYAEAVARHPEDAMSRVNLGNVLYESGEFQAAREQFETALRPEPGHAGAHQGLSYVLAELGDREGAERHRRRGFGDRPVVELPYRGDGPPVRLLLLISSVGGNIPLRHLLDDRVFQTFVMAPEFYDLKTPLPSNT